jgi:hypothetical protein
VALGGTCYDGIIPQSPVLPVKKQLPDRREFESIIRGISRVVFAVLALPIIVSSVALLAAILFGQGGLEAILAPNSGWIRLVSFVFCICMIPGISYLAYRGLRRFSQWHTEWRLFMVLASLTTATIMLFAVPSSQQRYQWSAHPVTPQVVREAVYKIGRPSKRAEPKTPFPRPLLHQRPSRSANARVFARLRMLSSDEAWMRTSGV